MSMQSVWRRLAPAALATCLAVVTESQGFAQVSAGLKGGLNVSSLGGKDVAEPGLDLDWRTGFTGGGFLNIRFGNYFAIQPEALFTQKGVKVTEQLVEEGFTTTVKGKLTLNYVEVPLLLQARVNLNADATSGPFVIAGPAIAFKTACNVKLSANGAPALDGKCEDPEFDSPAKSTDWSVIFGGGYALAMGNATLVLDARYQYGLRSIDDTPANDDVRNKSYAVTLGAALPFGAAVAAARR